MYWEKKYKMTIYKEYEGKLPGKIINDLKSEAEKRNLNDNQIKKVMEYLVDQYNAAKIDPGEAIGIITAESFGEPGTQMTGCIGQQALGGKRITRGYRGRTLSTFKENDLSPEARGFVKNTFKKGITPTEFFFHAMTGRDSLMDTALRTPKSGYLYRRLANALQDLKVEYDSTVRNATKEIIQFKYGEDSIDVSKSEGGTINVVNAIHDVLGEKV